VIKSKIFYILCLFKVKIIEKHGKNDIEKHYKSAIKKYFKHNETYQEKKKNIMGVTMLIFSIGEN
jgi:hypothetical protein